MEMLAIEGAFTPGGRVTNYFVKIMHLRLLFFYCPVFISFGGSITGKIT